MSEIKVLDAQKWFSGNAQERQEFAQSLLEGFQTAGFVKLVNHGLSDKCIDEAFEWTKRYYELPYKVKLQTANTPGPKPQRGWSSPGVEKTATLNIPENSTHDDLEDAKEHFDCGAPEDKMFPNVWPDSQAIQGFQPFVEDYFAQCQAISLGLMGALESGFNLPPGTFLSRFNENASELRLNHYPTIAAAKLADGTTNRIWPHTDFGIITLLLQDTVGGLEIWDKKTEEFRPVPARSRYDMIINTGDCLQRWTNDHIKAGLHRVVAPRLICKDHTNVPERFSLAFFLKAARNESAGPLQFFVDETHPALYDDITTLDFQRKRTAQVY